VIAFLDTSVFVKLLINEIGSDAARLFWGKAERLLASHLLHVEARAALAAAKRSRRLTAREYDKALEGFKTLWSQMAAVPIEWPIVLNASELAESDRLRGYDAVHLACALNSGAEIFASADGDLCAAARRHGMHVFNPNVLSG
jgi:uncharacterized protein